MRAQSRRPRGAGERGRGDEGRIDSAARWRAGILCGPFGSPLGVFSGVAPTADERAARSRPSRGRRARGSGRDARPRVPEPVRAVPDELRGRHRRVRQRGQPSQLRMMYDTFHANIEEKDVREAIATARVLSTSTSPRTTGARRAPGRSTGTRRSRRSRDRLRRLARDRGVRRALPDLAAATKIWRRMFEQGRAPGRGGVHPDGCDESPPSGPDDGSPPPRCGRGRCRSRRQPANTVP